MDRFEKTTPITVEDLVQARVRKVLDQAPAGCFESQTDGSFSFVNRQWVELAGMRAADALGDGWAAAIHFEDRDRVIKNWRDAVAREIPFSMEYRVERDSGETVWIAATACPVYDEQGQCTGYLGWMSDVSTKVNLESYLERALMDQVKVAERLKHEQAMLHTAERQFEAVFERASLGISIVGLDGCITLANLAMCDMTGFAREELIGKEATLLLVDEDRQRAAHAVITQLFHTGASHVSMEHRLQRADDRVRWVLSDSSLVHDDEGAPLFIVTLSTDVTERKLFEQRLAHEASHDPLTGLPNRSMLRELLEQAAARTDRRPNSLAVMFVDLDHFKAVNDTLGHSAGDDVLLQAASRIRTSLRIGDVAARYGGDEFVVVCEDIGGPAGAEIIAKRIRDAMRVPFVIGDASTTIGASVGVVMSDGSEDIDLLLHTADEALYDAKRAGRGRVKARGVSQVADDPVSR